MHAAARSEIGNPDYRDSASNDRPATNGIRRPTMNRFQSSTPRAALGIAAVAMTVVTFGLLVIVPATIESGSEDVRTQASAKLVMPAAAEAVIIPTRIDVLRAREMELA
jgi:hypothetical protein